MTQETNTRSSCFTGGCGKRMREMQKERKNALLIAQDWPIVQGPGQQPLFHCCCVHPVYLKPHQPFPTREHWNKPCIVPTSPRNAIYLVPGPTVWLSVGQLVPQALLRLPGSCMNNVFASKTLTSWKLFTKGERGGGEEKRDRVKLGQRQEEDSTGSGE